MNKWMKIATGYLGFSMFMFGMLKFFQPFKGWYTVQITQSELPFSTLSYWSGQLGEIVVGGLFIYFMLRKVKVQNSPYRLLFTLGNMAIVGMMLVAFYVHFHPNVPADVLPLKIKPPFVPGFFMAVALLNLVLLRKTAASNERDKRH